MIRPRTNGPRSLMVTITERPLCLFVTRTLVPNGSVRCAFSVLIPAVTLTSVSDHKTISTEAIITHHTGPNSVPITGIHETYQFIPLSGEASFVFALVEPLLGPTAKAGKS